MGFFAWAGLDPEPRPALPRPIDDRTCAHCGRVDDRTRRCIVCTQGVCPEHAHRQVGGTGTICRRCAADLPPPDRRRRG